MVLATLVGGEPTLAPRVIQYAARKFPVVWVVTNGSAKFPKVPRSVVYSVSIDGPPDHHNQTRDPLGFFQEPYLSSTCTEWQLLSSAISINRNAVPTPTLP